MASFKPSKMNWIDKAASTTAIILENTCSNFFEIYFSDFKNKINKDPENFIAQPILELSTVPIFDKSTLSDRHVDLRPFSLIGHKKFKLVSGALTRVALKKGSTIVNSSQGGGSKDTMIVEG